MSGSTLPLPRLLGVNSSIAILDVACAELSNGRPQESRFLVPVLDWIATFADLTLLRQFFALPTPAVAAVWRALYLPQGLNHVKKAAAILLKLAVENHRGVWARRYGASRHLALAIVDGDKESACLLEKTLSEDPFYLNRPYTIFETDDDICHTEGGLIALMESAIQFFIQQNRMDTELDKLLGEFICGNIRFITEAVHWFVDSGVKMHPAMSKWVPLTAQLLPPDWAQLCGSSRLARHHLHRFSCIRITRIMDMFLAAWGCIAAAKQGQQVFQQFVHSLDGHTTPPKEQVLQMALSETAGQDDTEIATFLVRNGVDPEVKLLPTSRYSSFHPLDRALEKGNLHMIGFLFKTTFYSPQRITEALSLALACPDMLSAADLAARGAAVGLVFNTAFGSIWKELSAVRQPPWTTPTCPLRTAALQHIQLLIETHPDLSSENCALLSMVFPHHTIRQTIQWGFSLNAVKSLYAAENEIPSHQSDRDENLLVDALLTPSRARYQMVQFLLSHGADPRKNCQEFTVLQATLWNTASEKELQVTKGGVLIAGTLDPDEDRRVTLRLFSELLELGATLGQSSATGSVSEGLLTLLIKCCASPSMIRQIVAAGACVNERYNQSIAKPGANVNERCNPGVTTPLACAVKSGQLATAALLIECGADVNGWVYPRGSRFAESVLSIACRFSQKSMVDLLIGKGASVDLPAGEGRGRTPLCSAVRRGDMDIVLTLLAKGVNISNVGEKAEGPWWPSAVDLAAHAGELDILKLLIDYGGQSEEPGDSGFDGAFWLGIDHPGVCVFLEDHTGWTLQRVTSPKTLKTVLVCR